VSLWFAFTTESQRSQRSTERLKSNIRKRSPSEEHMLGECAEWLQPEESATCLDERAILD